MADERGIILVVSLMMLALLIAAGVGAIVSVQIDLRTSANLKTEAQAIYIAEAGLSHARREMQYGTTDFKAVFAAEDGTEIVSNSSFSSGSYKVTRQGSVSDPDRVKIHSIGIGPNNSRAVIEAWFKKDAGRASRAIESNGDLTISGNPIFPGTCGGAHANEDMKIDGNPGLQITGGLSVSNQTTTKRGSDIANGMDISGTPCVGSADCAKPLDSRPTGHRLDTAEARDRYVSGHNSAPLRNTPRINPSAYAPLVAAMAAHHYILHDDGTVTVGGFCGAEGLCSGGTKVEIPHGWEFSDSTWRVRGNNAAEGVFYSETRVEISASPGSPSSPWQATLIARGSALVSGSPHIRPYPTESEALKDHLFVTGDDLKITGNMTANYAPGAILVHQQFRISGDPRIRGFILSGDGLPTWAGDPFPPSTAGSGVALNEISGNPTITYSCDFGCNGPGCPSATVGIISWVHRF